MSLHKKILREGVIHKKLHKPFILCTIIKIFKPVKSGNELSDRVRQTPYGRKCQGGTERGTPWVSM